MELNTVASLVREDLTTISACFKGDINREYIFKCTKGLAETLVKGDRVLVRNQGSGTTTVTVAAVHDEPQLDVSFEGGYKWAFQKIDIDTCIQLEQLDLAIENKLREQQRMSARQQVLMSLGIGDVGEFMKSLGCDEQG